MKQSIIKMKDDYLKSIEKYRKEGRRIIFQGEARVFKNMSCKKVRKDIVGESSYKHFAVPSRKR